MKYAWGILGYTAFILSGWYWFKGWIDFSQLYLGMTVAIVGIIHWRTKNI